jgi:hypothetical protein
MAVRTKREPGTYVVFGTDGPELIRLPSDLRARVEKLNTKLDRPSRDRGKLLGALIALGAETVGKERGKPPRTFDELMAYHDRGLRGEIDRSYQRTYREVPGPGIGQYVAYLLRKGIDRFNAG